MQKTCCFDKNSWADLNFAPENRVPRSGSALLAEPNLEPRSLSEHGSNGFMKILERDLEEVLVLELVYEEAECLRKFSLLYDLHFKYIERDKKAIWREI